MLVTRVGSVFKPNRKRRKPDLGNDSLKVVQEDDLEAVHSLGSIRRLNLHPVSTGRALH